MIGITEAEGRWRDAPTGEPSHVSLRPTVSQPVTRLGSKAQQPCMVRGGEKPRREEARGGGSS
jgi:hypothetical protein